jgi:predicted metalloprotease with PDZ domain
MKRVVSLLALAALVLVAVPAFAGGEKCTADAQTCLNHMAAKMKASGWAGLMYDKAADGSKVVKSVEPNSPAAAAGFQPGDVLVAMNGIELVEKNHEALGKVDRKPGSTITYTIRRGSEEKKLAVTLEPMSQDAIAANVGHHMVEAHVATQTAEAATPAAETASTKK